MNQLVLGTYLSPGRRSYVRDLMATVTSTQRWGLGDPLPDAVHVELKNGWGPMSTGYRLNSFGHVSGYGRSYQMAILSKSPNGYTYGKDDDQPGVAHRLRRARRAAALTCRR